MKAVGRWYAKALTPFGCHKPQAFGGYYTSAYISHALQKGALI